MEQPLEQSCYCDVRMCRKENYLTCNFYFPSFVSNFLFHGTVELVTGHSIRLQTGFEDNSCFV